MVVVVSDFEEGYPLGGLLAETRSLVESGCDSPGAAPCLDDVGLACGTRCRWPRRAASAAAPVAALSPLELARWVGERRCAL